MKILALIFVITLSFNICFVEEEAFTFLFQNMNAKVYEILGNLKLEASEKYSYKYVLSSSKME